MFRELNKTINMNNRGATTRKIVYQISGFSLLILLLFGVAVFAGTIFTGKAINNEMQSLSTGGIVTIQNNMTAGS